MLEVNERWGRRTTTPIIQMRKLRLRQAESLRLHRWSVAEPGVTPMSPDSPQIATRAVLRTEHPPAHPASKGPEESTLFFPPFAGRGKRLQAPRWENVAKATGGPRPRAGWGLPGSPAGPEARERKQEAAAHVRD